LYEESWLRRSLEKKEALAASQWWWVSERRESRGENDRFLESSIFYFRYPSFREIYLTLGAIFPHVNFDGISTIKFIHPLSVSLHSLPFVRSSQ
jgi:hypothetical protein